MKSPYRVYTNVSGNETFFEARDDGWFCTHGAWYGNHIEVDGKPALKHVYGIATYDAFEDLTDEQYEVRYNNK